MRTTIALLAALAATPAMACTDWKAIAAFDAIVASHYAVVEARCTKTEDKLNQGVAEYHRDFSK